MVLSVTWTAHVVVAPITKPYTEWLCNYCALGNYNYHADNIIFEMRDIRSIFEGGRDIVIRGYCNPGRFTALVHLVTSESLVACLNNVNEGLERFYPNLKFPLELQIIVKCLIKLELD